MSIRETLAMAILFLAFPGSAPYGQGLNLPKSLETPEVQAALTSTKGRRLLQSAMASMSIEIAAFRAEPVLIEYYSRLDAGEDFAAFLAIQGPAQAGHAHAQAELGWMYFAGIGTSEDIDKAIEWYTRSSKQGDLGATSTLGAIYSSPTSNRLKLPEATRLLESCSIKRRPSCVIQVALLYALTDNPQRSVPKAVAWMSIALEAGLPGAELAAARVKKIASIADVYEAESIKPQILQMMLESEAREVEASNEQDLVTNKDKKAHE